MGLLASPRPLGQPTQLLCAPTAAGAPLGGCWLCMDLLQAYGLMGHLDAPLGGVLPEQGGWAEAPPERVATVQPTHRQQNMHGRACKWHHSLDEWACWRYQGSWTNRASGRLSLQCRVP